MLKEVVSPPELAERAGRVMQQICDRGWAVSTAESCTGGLVAALLTDIEGCSHVFDSGFITYAEAAKTDLLGVDAQLLKQNGAVSREVAVAMAEGALRRSRADIALAVTGFAGPTDTAGEEGTAHFALAQRNHSTRHRMENFGSQGRDIIRQLCLKTLLEMLEEAVRAS